MLTRIVHRIVARPQVYDLVQFLAGASAMRRRMAAQIAALGPIQRVVDVGGGTGAGREAVPPGCSYICLDIDPLKIQGFVEKNPGHLAIVADATRMPLSDASLDAVIFMFVAHHLSEELLGDFLREAARVLKPAGSLIFADPLWEPRRWASRLLWRYDRGSCPRTAAKLRQIVSGSFEIAHWEEFAVWHAYVLAVGRPRQRRAAGID
jgi:ubiquinone/menaquinone biosynthesis C-methylase UbiE